MLRRFSVGRASSNGAALLPSPTLKSGAAAPHSKTLPRDPQVHGPNASQKMEAFHVPRDRSRRRKEAEPSAVRLLTSAATGSWLQLTSKFWRCSLPMNRLICGADWQSAVSRVGNPQTATIHSPRRRLPIGETADSQSALPDSHGSSAQCAHKVRGVLSWGCGRSLGERQKPSGTG